MLRASLLTVLTLSLAAQDKAKAEAPKPAAKPAAAAADAKPAPAAPKPVNKIVARVGDRIVRQSEVDAAMAALPPQQQQQLMLVQGAREMYTKQFVEMQLLAAKARRDGVEKTEAFKRKAENALTQVLATEVLAKEGPALQAKMAVKDEEVKGYYEAHKDKFMTPEKFTARHILVGIKSDRMPQGGTEEEAKAKVAKIEAALKEGKKLEDLVKDYSDDGGSKDKGGLYENISFGQFVPEFEKAVREQKVGEVGPAVKTMFGYHFIQVVKLDKAEQESFEVAKDKAKQALTKERQEQVWGDFLGTLKKDIPFQFGGEISESSVKAPKAARATKKAAK